MNIKRNGEIINSGAPKRECPWPTAEYSKSIKALTPNKAINPKSRLENINTMKAIINKLNSG